MAVGGLEMLVAQAVYAAEYFLGRKFEDARCEIDRITAALRRDTAERGPHRDALLAARPPWAGLLAEALGKRFV